MTQEELDARWCDHIEAMLDDCLMQRMTDEALIWVVAGMGMTITEEQIGHCTALIEQRNSILGDPDGYYRDNTEGEGFHSNLPPADRYDFAHTAALRLDGEVAQIVQSIVSARKQPLASVR